MSHTVSDTEATLISLALSGDADAVGQLSVRYRKPLLGYVMAHCCCSQADADDMLQEIWTRIWLKLNDKESATGYDPSQGGFYSFIINRYLKFAVRKKWEPTANKRMLSLVDDVGDEQRSDEIVLQCDDDNPEMGILSEEENSIRNQAFIECFRLTFEYGGYPHQVLAFAYSKLILGKKTKPKEGIQMSLEKRIRQVEGSPQKLDENYGASELSQVMKAFRHDFAEAAGLPDTLLMPLFSLLLPTEDRLRLTVIQMSEGNKTFQSAHHDKLQRVVGTTCFRDYYGSRGVQAIPDWCDKVRRRVMEKLGL